MEESCNTSIVKGRTGEYERLTTSKILSAAASWARLFNESGMRASMRMRLIHFEWIFSIGFGYIFYCNSDSRLLINRPTI